LQNSCGSYKNSETDEEFQLWFEESLEEKEETRYVGGLELICRTPAVRGARVEDY
jgi:hypothetical protein